MPNAENVVINKHTPSIEPLSKYKQQRRNLNKHTARGIGMLDAAMAQDGYVAPMTATADGEIIDGSARHEVAGVRFGDEALVVRHDGTKPIVMIREDIPNADDPRAVRIALAANRIAQVDLDFDLPLLAELSQEIDLSGLWSETELSELTGKLVEVGKDVDPQVDKAEELRQKWGVESGQLWACGEHRVLCGDSTNRADVERVMAGEKAQLVVTDPPYGVSYGDKNRFLNAIGRPNTIEKPIDNDHLGKEQTQKMWKSAFSEMFTIMSPGAVFYCFMPQGGDQMMMMMMMMMEAGIEPRHELIWLKNNHVLGRSDYCYKHEPILYAWKEGGHKFYGDFQTSVLEYDRPQKSDLHPTTKPLLLVEKLMLNSSQSGEVVYDPFSGSGTTLIACQNLQRKCRAIEIDPGYTAVTLQRFQDLTDQTPTLL